MQKCSKDVTRDWPEVLRFVLARCIHAVTPERTSVPKREIAMGQVQRLCSIGLFLTAACGSSPAPADAGEERALLASTPQELAAVRVLAGEEKTAVELARSAEQRPHTGRSFRDYVIIQRRLHEELLTQLLVLAPAVGETGDVRMSDAGRAMQAAIDTLEGEALEARYYALQRPWQKAVLQQLRTTMLPADYQRAALQRWARDLAALEALDR